MEFIIPQKRNRPFIPLVGPDGQTILLMDFGTLDGHQAEEIAAKIAESKPKKLLVPRHVMITRMRDRLTKEISGYRIEQEEA
jgi:hypothetical protein